MAALEAIARAIQDAPATSAPLDRPITSEPRYRHIIERWQRFWALEPLDPPLWLFATDPVLTAASIISIVEDWDMLTLMRDPSVLLDASLRVLRWRESTDYGDDFVPRLIPQLGTTVFASAFGSQVEFFKHTLPWAHPVILPEDPPTKAAGLQAPSIDAGQLGEALALCDRFRRQTGVRYPIAQTDMQGPLDIAYLVWEPQSFMLAMYTSPIEVHHLMRLATDLLIAFVKEQRRRCGEFIPCHYPPLYIPDGLGLLFSDDCLAVLSPQLYRDFALPYVNEISEEFGGVFIHSCGNFAHQLDNLASIRNLRGINFGASEMPFAPLWQHFGGKVALIPHYGLNVPEMFTSNAGFVAHLTSICGPRARGLGVILGPTESDAGHDLSAFAAESQKLARQLA